MRLKRLYIIFLMCLLPFCGNAQNSFSVDAPNVVGAGEIFRVVYTADGEVDEFVPPTITGGDILAGPTPSTMRRVSVINGKRTQSYEVSYTYILRPSSSNPISISQAVVKIGDRSYQSRALSIEVVESTSSSSNNTGNTGGYGSTEQEVTERRQSAPVAGGDVFLKLTVNKAKVVKGEPLTATLELYTNAQIVGFEDIKFPVFNGFWSQETESPQNLNFKRERVGNKIYNTAVLRKYVLLPQQTGKLVIDPAELVAQIQVRVNSRMGSVFDDFFDEYQTVKKKITSSPVTIDVKPLPSGAPASFAGGVGNFSMNVRLSKERVKANEAASLMVDILGDGNMNLMEAPVYEFPVDFEVYDVKTINNFSNSVYGMKGKKSFEIPFIPRTTGEYVLPPVKYSYYDLKDKEYKILSSDSIRINVLEGDNTSGGVLSGRLSKQEVTNLRDDIMYITTGNSGLKEKDSFFLYSVGYFATVMLLLILGIVFWLILQSYSKLKKDVKRTKSRRANKVAVKRLNLAKDYLKQNLSVSFYEELHKAMMGYIADKLAIPFADLQKDNISEILKEKGIKDEDINSLMSILDDCEMARYSGQSVNNGMTDLYDRALSLLSHFENIL